MRITGANRFFLLLTLTSALLAPNCATLTRRSAQRIPVTSSPIGAAVIVNGVEQGVTPIEIKLARKQKGQVIRIESPGYNPFEIRPQRKLSGETILGSILLGLVPGMVPALVWLGSSHTKTDPAEENTILSIYFKSAAVLGGLFALTDFGGGKGYTQTPKNLTVTLTKADGPPRVDTMLLDAEDFRNIKWIRVRKD